MLSIGLISLLVAIPVFSYRITPSLFNRITSVVLIYSALLAFNGLHIESLASGVGIYSGLFHVTTLSVAIEGFLLFTGALILLGWGPITEKTNVSNSLRTTTVIPSISEYSLMILFTSMGATLLLSSSDLVSMYLSIELQSFAVYILATLYRDSESATSAGLKYFLLGGLSSALILLGTALIYSYTGLTQFESIYTLVQVTGSNTMGYSSVYNGGVTCGLLLIGIGFLFKVAAAPLHNWAPDVYDGVPTIVTSWLTTMPKISIFVFLLELQSGLEGSFESLSLLLGDDSSINIWKNLLLIASILSLIIGTVVGLSQYRIKRLLAYSTISHVGFLLLALAINTEESIESFLFYLIQYSLTNVNTFLILLAFGYILSTSKSYLLANRTSNKQSINTTDIQFIDQLKGQFKENPLLGLSLALCLFSMAGIPPLIGFFAKQMVLYSSTHGGYYFLSIIAILVSVISASYYLKIIRVIYFDTQDTSNDIVNTNTTEDLKENTTLPKITNVHSLLISSLTMIILLFVLQPSILLNSCHILALSLFYY
jgi:NADH-ubiquinone oxidoreductase chain 2|nr:NADH dehydrogenase subunit 2 [Macalpinomyces bursus]QUA00849.1 NADH dehydrogenase subunit 2 [Macalpinomyces bursus]